MTLSTSATSQEATSAGAMTKKNTMFSDKTAVGGSAQVETG